MRNQNDLNEILILGVGNILLQDEGIGIHAISKLEELGWPDHIKLLDGGTGGFHMLSVFQEYKTIIMIDAALDQDPPGTIKVLEPKFSKDFPKALSSHDIGLKDLLDSANLLGPLPKIHLIAVTIKPQQNLKMELSDEMREILPEIVKEVKNILNL